MARIHFAGDTTLDQYIYVTRASSAPDARETWTGATEVLSFEIHGATGGASDALRAVDPGLAAADVTLSCVPPRPPRSLFLLREDKGRWSIETSVVTGQEAARKALGDEPCRDSHDLEKGRPLVLLDYEQGWVLRHRALLPELLSGRPALIRSHDPSGAPWRTFREQNPGGAGGRTWFSNLQDLAGGSIQAPGTWRDVRERAVAHLTRDPTLWDGNGWRENVVLQLQQDGILLLPQGSGRLGELYVVSQAQPGSLSREGFGNVSGSGILLMASLAQPLAERGEYNLATLREAVRTGLLRVRSLIRAGHRLPAKGETLQQRFYGGHDVNGSADEEVVSYQLPKADLETATAIVTSDEAAFRRATVLKLGNLITADEQYAGTLLGLFSRLKNHLKAGRKVLSFAVFGGPGSGKSMVAKQIAKVLDPEGKQFDPIEFNLSQFDRPERLIGALRQVEKIGHRGRVPLVLWDEFDGTLEGQRRGWLSHFLMPMQDAEFFDGGEVRKLPEKCVFVFIGGTFKTGGQFKTWALGEEGAALKGRDFHSRLDRSLDIADLELARDDNGQPLLDVPDTARLRRAILLRHWLKNDYPRVRRIDSNVLQWLLHVPLAHGTRSLEGILKASELGLTEHFQPHHLPSREMLELHLSRELELGSGESFSERLQRAGGTPLELEFRKSGK
ncbi:MAG TPA: hypothetical protein VK447_19570 [Myxococcaceae bacterium]|nr:hypothetical protein [Myxococcaceae bacterium]